MFCRFRDCLPWSSRLAREGTGTHGQEKHTILLVEDETLIAMAQRMYLEKYDYKVLTTNTGKKAVEVLKEDNQLELAFLPGSKKAPLEKSGYNDYLQSLVMQSIGIIVNELLTSIMKYAFKNRKSGYIKDIAI